MQPALFDDDQDAEVKRLREQLDRLNTEHTRLGDQYARLLRERSEWERSVREAAGRNARAAGWTPPAWMSSPLRDVVLAANQAEVPGA